MINTIQVPLRTHYYDIRSSRCMNEFQKSTTFSHFDRRREDLEVRLNYEYEYCKSLGGQVFYYTFTFNDKALPYFHGRACHDYQILREITHGAFEKYLINWKNIKLRYFICAELGEGGKTHNFVGSRGKGHNPHYHAIFFLYPLVKGAHILPSELCYRLRMLWQGSEHALCDEIKFCTNAKYGFCMPGNNEGFVDSVKALRYVAKYCSKSIDEINFEKDLFSECFNYYFDSVSEDSCKQYLIDNGLECHFSKLTNRLLKKKLISPYNAYYERLSHCYIDDDNSVTHADKFEEFITSKAFDYAHEELKLFRNRYSTKVRYSSGLGRELGVKDICKDLLNPTLHCPTATSTDKEKPLSLYYLRQVYYFTIKDGNGNNKYVLKGIGRKMLLNKFQKNYDKNIYNISCKLATFTNDYLINSFVKYYEDRCITYNPAVVKDILLGLDFDNYGEKNSIFERYYIYKKIYQYRYTNSLSTPIDPVNHYKFYLRNCVWYASFHEDLVNTFKRFNDIKDYEGFYSYDLHPYFSCYLDTFSLFDKLLDFYAYNLDQFNNKAFEENERLVKFHNNLKFNNDYD